MRTRHGAFLFAASGIAASLLASGQADAQARSDVDPALPNVMLLVDSSGSMEFKSNGGSPYCSIRDPSDTLDATVPNPGGTPPDERSKWLSLVEVLTGNFTSYKCAVEGRSSLAYQTEFSYGGTPGSSNPYDFLYFLGYHRFVSQLDPSKPWCAFGPDKSGANSWVSKFASKGAHGAFWAGDPQDDGSHAPGIRNYVVANSAGTWGVNQAAHEGSATISCPGYDSIPQDKSGLLDQFANSARFGLMTYDTNVDASTGFNPSATPTGGADYDGGHLGMWSYFQDWHTKGFYNCNALGTTSGGAPYCDVNCDGDSGNTSTGVYLCARGKPNGCTTDPTPVSEVGARNAAAPPWEGRMIGFPTDDTSATILAQNKRIQKALMTIRPYGATPTAGLLQDAETYLVKDQMPDYSSTTGAGLAAGVTTCGGSTPCFGPRNDPFSSCRKSYLILLTDGSPNMDLHPWCDPPLDATNPGKCPYRTADAIAYDLYNNWSSLGLPGPVATYVVGFAPAQPQITYSSPCPTTGANAFKCDDGSTCSTGQTCSMANRTIDCTQLQTQLLGGQSLLSGPNAQGLYSCNTAAVAGLSSANQAALQVCCDLAKISYAGGTGNPYYASNANALRAQLSTILSSVSAQKTSRTPPIFSPAYSSRDSFAGQYEINSSFTIAPGQIWSGILERQRTACVASGSNPAVPTPQTYFPGGSSTYNGDDFAYNVNQWASDSQHPRRIFSAYPTIDALSVTQPYHSTWSMRWPTTASGITPTASVNAPADGVSSLAVPWRNINMWGLPTVATSSTTADGSSFLRPNGADILGGVMQVATNNCAGDIDPTRIGTGANAVVATPADANACARRIMSWALGLPQLADGNGNKPPTRADVFGAIYRSPPVVVGPPGEAISDEAYRAYAAAQAARPIMLYTQTLDGQLHAFKVDKNPLEPARSDRLDFTVRGSTSGGSALQNEVWSFIPPAALVGIPTMYPASQQIILDGPVVVRDVRWTRFANSSAAIGSLANQNSATWKRVLVAGFGQGPDASGLNGGGYYALDVTDWANPVMLWQLTTDGLGNPLFGAGGVPVITQLFFDDPDDHFGEYPVAILPGGGSLSPSSGTTSITWGTSNSNVGNSSSYAPRTSFKGYSTSDQSRSITIVRLDTGGIVRTWRPLSSITTLQGRNAVTLTNVATTLPPNPVTGTAATFPAGTGQVANRAFIGDSEGLLWRLDLGDPSPANWKFKLFWDSYNNGICSSGNCQWKVDGTGKSATISGGQPIQQAPVLSVDRLGNLTIAYSTGDGNDYTNAARTQSGGLYQGAPVNWLVSLREQPLPTTNNSTPYWSELLWFRGFGAGERVVGPTTLFNSTLYVTTILPQSTQTCSASDARLYGFDYIIPRTVTSSGTDYADGGAVRLTGSNANCSAGLNYIDLSKDPANSCAVSTTGVASFGVSVQQTLTCTAPTASGAGDALLGLGNHTSLTNFTTGTSSPYQLVVQTGRGGSAVSNAQTNQRALALTTPPMVARIDSWAAVTE